MGKKTSNFIAGGLVGILGGIGLSIATSNIWSPVQKTKIIEKRSTPGIMKVYTTGKDQILVENCKGDYIPLSNYLKRFDNKLKRNLEKAEIEYLVSEKEK